MVNSVIKEKDDVEVLLINPDIIDDHMLREYRCQVGISGPVASNGHIKDKELWKAERESRYIAPADT